MALTATGVNPNDAPHPRDRSGNADIYAQRVNSSGIPQWTGNGVVVCDAGGDQTAPSITSDGAGGAIIAWQDASGPDNDIYVQRISSAGVALWTVNGVEICGASGDQWVPVICTDGGGGGIVAWEDSRSGLGDDIYAQRVNSSGTPQWAANGKIVCNASGGQ